eukprot:TRINITY_DN705_c1_g2_i1.p1 TRINITY_DN705_c1_g2~~TRINITY_DN705_c1_g2_i1.p1  ORF type:complete len:531 (+),score=155.60 TRINITY_DN705_c1_g2_i1:32-1594(+)
MEAQPEVEADTESPKVVEEKDGDEEEKGELMCSSMNPPPMPAALRALFFKEPVKQMVSSSTVMTVLVAHWDPVRGPSLALILRDEACSLDEDEIQFLGRFALLSAVPQGEVSGITYTSLPQLDVGVTAVLFQAPILGKPDTHVQYCMNIVVPLHKTDRFVYLSASVNDRLEWTLNEFLMLLKKDITREDLANEFRKSLSLFITHLDTWMAAIVPPDFPISATILNEPNVDKDFLAAVISTHLTYHQRTVIKSHSPATANLWLRALILHSSPDVWQLSRLLPENDTAGNVRYTPELFLQGVLTTTHIPDSELQLSRNPSCVIDVDAQQILVCRPLNNYDLMRKQNKKKAMTVPQSELLHPLTQPRPAVCVRSMVAILLQIHPLLRAGFATEWRRWYFRKARAMVTFVELHLQIPRPHDDDGVHVEGGNSVTGQNSMNGSFSVRSGPSQNAELQDDYKNMPYLPSEKTKLMKTLLELPTTEDVLLVLSAAEMLHPGTYNKVCGDSIQVNLIAHIVRTQIGII